MADNPNNEHNLHDQQHDNTPFFEEDDFLAAERFDEFEDDLNDPPIKMNFKEIWDKNPSVKIFAIIAGLAVLLIGFMAFGGGDDNADDFSMVKQARDVSQPPGTAELPPAYEEAIRKASEQRAELAAMTEGSSLPTPIARPSERIEAPVQVEEIDPLSAWRREAEARRSAPREPALSLDNVSPPSLPTLSPPVDNFGPPTQAQVQQQPPPPPLPTAPAPEMVSALAAQMQQQMQTVLETQIPRESIVVSMNLLPGYDIRKYFPPEEQLAQTGQAGFNQNGMNVSHASAATGANMPAEQPKPIIAAGTIAYAQVLTQANSDVPGPVLAEIASTTLVGGRAIGQFQVAENHLVLQFNRIVKDGVEYPIQGFALDPGTTLPGVATRVDNHYFSRVFLPAAARFIEGFADAATRQESSAVVSNGTVVTTTGEKLDTKQEIMEGVNRGAQEISRMLDADANRRKTIIVDAGTRIGILFMSSVFDPNTMQNQYQNNMIGQNLPNAIGAYSNFTPAGAAYNMYNTYQGAGQNYNYAGQNYNAYSPSNYMQPPIQPRRIGY